MTHGLMARLTIPRLTLTLAGALLLAAGPPARAQAPAGGGRVEMSLTTFVDRVLATHPEARMAALMAEQAGDELFAARGAWEPVLKASWDRKLSGNTQYYDDAVAALVVPTPLGADLKLGFERASGRYLNAERSNLGTGQFTLGVSMPLTRGIATDERRRRLQVARARRDVADAERTLQLADLVRDAARDYGGWLEAARRYEIAQEGVRLATVRLQVVRAGWETGDLAAIDTVDAQAEVARRRASALEAGAALYAAERRVEARLWDRDGRATALPDAMRPASSLPQLAGGPGIGAPTAAAVELATRNAGRAHPAVRRARARVDEAAADRLYAAQRLLPALYVDAGALAPGRTLDALGTPDPLAGSHKIGASLEFAPLLLGERGRLNAARGAEDRAEAGAALALRLAEVRTRIAANDLQTLTGAVELQRAVVRDTRTLLDAERFRFEAGETTLLVLTLRERALLDEESRLATLEARIATAWGELSAALGDPRAISRLSVEGGA